VNERREGRPGCVCDAGRRGFLAQTAALVTAALAGVATPAQAGGLPVAWAEAGGRSGDELTYPIPAADGATIDRDNGVIVVRFQGKLFAFNLSCPHENAAVRWKAALGRFECSRHDSVYTPAGIYTSGRATRNMDRFAVKRNGGSLVVDVSKMIQSDQQKAAWEAAALAL
jgi:Rieske Fe-S protein